MSKQTTKPTPSEPVDNVLTDAELDALNLKLQEAETINGELVLEIDSLQKGNAQIVEENDMIKKQADALEDTITTLQANEQILLGQVETLTKAMEDLSKELITAKSTNLTQVIRLDVLAAAAYNRTPSCSSTNAAKAACEIHEAIIAECNSRADKRKTTVNTSA